ncbi:DUF7563 family protein [Haloarcula marina]|uniref:DUF7563 family protein n=1 Tax=Haloarcula marina TaxID=2961574 RepID=UPI0020B70B44|nr:hypothetical protein [Halomicroarcula marina]
MPSCDHCGAHVSPTYYRTRKGNDGDLHGCPNCTSPATRERDAAGVSSSYIVRTDADARSVARDGGESE